MTEISNVVSYYPSLMYRQQSSGPETPQPTAQQSPSPNQSSPQQQQQQQQQQLLNQQQQQQQQQHQLETAVNQQCPPWYNYTHAAAVAHHQQAQQYFAEHEASLWPHPHTYLQYQHHQHYQQQQQQQINASQLEWSGDEANNNSSGNTSGNNNSGVGAGEPSPPITVSGSEISSPGTPASPPANNNNVATVNNNIGTPMRPGQNRSPYEWMKKPSYQNQPNSGKTRTKDKYRVVYTEHQRLELEKEFYSSRYITIRRKAELASSLALSERQVKIWFQNRRAKDRKQSKKRNELEQRDVKPMIDAHGVAHPAHGHPPIGGMAGLSLGGMSMSGMLGGLIHQNASPSLGHHHPHHHQAVAAAAAAAHHHALLAAHHPPQQHSVIGTT